MKHFIRMTLFALVLVSSSVFSHGDEEHHAGKQDHAAAIGKPGNLAKVSRTIEVNMDDNMRFTPANIAVKRGETIKFVVKNNGKLKHEMVLGSAKELKEHAELMRKFPEMEHDEPNQIAVDPGKSGELIWQFTKTGKFDFACLQPGHFEAGMVGKIKVLSKAEKKIETADHAIQTTPVAIADHATSIVSSATDMSDGEVKKVDKDAGKITIKHGPIASLGMPAMTMVFRVKEPSMLDQVKVGDKIGFIAEKLNGAITITKLEPAN